jgi:hypothetical protein
MTSKRQRRRARSSSSAKASSSSTPVKATPVTKEDREKATDKPAKAGKGPSRPIPETPYSTLSVTIARGLRAVGSSPEILAVAFLSLLATWGAFVLLGAEPGPRTMSLLMSAAPVHVFSDAPAALAPGSTPQFSVVAAASLALLRGVSFALLTLLIVQMLRDGRASIRDALRALPRMALVFVALYLIEFGLVVAAFQLLLAFLGQLAILAIVAGLYFLVFAPVVAAAEGDGPRPALRRSMRAARLPGTRHISLVLMYFLLLFYSGAVAPFGVVSPATPSIAVWAYALVATFIHVSMLAAFASRWLEARDQVPAAASK